jgi:hypothetical protein
MIKTEIGYRRSLTWLQRFEMTLEQTKQEYLPDRPEHFKIYADGTIAQIEDLKKEIADYERQHLKRAS